MQKVLVSLLLAAVVGLLAVVSIHFFGEKEEPRPDQQLEEDLALLSRRFDELTMQVERLSEEVDRLATARPESRRPGNVARAGPSSPETNSPAENAPAPEAPPEDVKSPEFKDYIFALIEEKKRLDAEERQKWIEEMRREREEMSKGPYGRFNLKVNSMAKVLNLDDGQRDRYYELVKSHWEALQELRKNTDWKNREARTLYRQKEKEIRDAFDAEVQAMLTQEQLDVYQKLSSWAKNPQSLNRAATPGEPDAFSRFRTYFDAGGGGTSVLRLGR